jgi:small conductance mechanosensitive channel
VEQEWLQRAVIAGVVFLLALVLARLADRAISRRLKLEPEALTRYRVLRRTAFAAIAVVGLLSALLVIPEVRAVAGGILASSAVVGLVLGMAARTTLGNLIAGLFIAFTQPLRLGDEVEVGGDGGRVCEIALTYTILETDGGARLYIPNEKLASDTIRNSTIARQEHLAQVDVPVPLSADLDRVVAALQEEAAAVDDAIEEREARVTVTQLEGEKAVVTLAAWARPGKAADLESGLRRAALRRLRADGVV